MTYIKQNFKDGKILTANNLNLMEEGIVAKQDVENLTTVLDENSDDTHYPSAKAVYDFTKAYVDELEGISEWDYVITSVEGFTTANLAQMSGRVLVKNLSLKADYLNVTVPSSISEIRFVNCTIYGRITTDSHNTKIVGFNGTENMAKHSEIVDCGCVEHCKYVDISDCGNVSNCVIYYAINCYNLTQIEIIPSYEIILEGCSILNNVLISPINNGSSEISECSHLSNIFSAFTGWKHSITYTECTHVDGNTCDGFYTDEDAGKVRSVSSDGTTPLVSIYSQEEINKKFDGIAIKKRIGGISFTVDDVSPVAHTVKVKVKGSYGGTIDPSTVTVTRCGVDETDNPIIFTPEADGTAEIPSLSPTMTFFSDTVRAYIEVEYNQDSNSVVGEIIERKVDKIEPNGEFCQLYGIDDTGVENPFGVDFEYDANEGHIPIRNTNLSIYIPNAPEEETDAVNKAYVDGLIGDIRTDVENAMDLANGFNEDIAELYNRIGKIDTALDNIIAIQEGLIGTILFTIRGTEYTALSGMTWAEWVNSQYNTDGVLIIQNDYGSGINLMFADTENMVINEETSEYQNPLTVIVDGAAYTDD